MRIPLAAVLVLISAQPLTAQGDAIMLLDTTFVGGATDSAVVILSRGQLYRAELSGAGREPVLNHSGRRASPAIVARAEEQPSTGAVRFDIFARESGPHVVRIAGLTAGARAHLELSADVEGQQALDARNRERRARQWQLGLRLEAGSQSEFLLDNTESAGGGATLGAALQIASGRFPVALALGFGLQQGLDNFHSVNWFYAEPQLRVIRRAGITASLLGQYAQGSGEAISRDPSAISVGAQVTYQIGGDDSGRGFATHVRYTYGWISNIPAEGQHLSSVMAGVLWLP